MADKKISALAAAATPLAGTEVLPIVQSNSTVKVSVSDLTAGRSVSASSLSTANGYTFYGDTATTYTLLRVVGATANPGVFIKAVESTKNVHILGSGSSVGGQKLCFGADGVDNAFTVGAANVEVSTGNLVIGTAGKGIDFSANTHAAGMTSELLDWYEEGDFTVTAGASSGLNGVWTAGTGKYTRIGNRVEFTIQFTGSGIGFSSLLGYYNFSGLPFTCAAEGSSGTWATLSVSGALAGAVVIVGSSNEFWLYAPNNTGTADAVSVCGSYRV